MDSLNFAATSDKLVDKCAGALLSEFDHFPIDHQLVHPDIIQGLGNTQFITGPQNAFMSLSFRLRGFSALDGRPEVILKTKNQDFVLGTEIHYKFSSNPEFRAEDTAGGSFVLAVRTDLLRKSRWQQNVKSTWTKLCSKKLQVLLHV